MHYNPQGEGLFVVFKLKADGTLDTGSYTGSYAYKPPARMYNTPGKAKAQWGRFKKAGYGARAAKIHFNDGVPTVEFIDQDWVAAADLCKFKAYGKTCKLLKGHEGIHQ
jgi:hypothetical protein